MLGWACCLVSPLTRACRGVQGGGVGRAVCPSRGSPVTEAVRVWRGTQLSRGNSSASTPTVGGAGRAALTARSQGFSPCLLAESGSARGPWGQEAQEEQPGPALVPVSLLTTYAVTFRL